MTTYTNYVKFRKHRQSPQSDSLYRAWKVVITSYTLTQNVRIHVKRIVRDSQTTVLPTCSNRMVQSSAAASVNKDEHKLIAKFVYNKKLFKIKFSNFSSN